MLKEMFYHNMFENFSVRPGKLWTLEISQECLLCSDQSLQEHTN